jgi:DNA polymerase delta subunit 4
MAPKRRTASARPTPAGQQAKLSFANKVTKAGAKHQAKDSKKDPALVEDILRTDIKAEAEPDLEEITTAEEAIQQQVEEEASTLDSAQDPLEAGDEVTTESVLGGRAEQSDVGAIGGKASGWVADEEQRARKTTDTQIKSYWRKKEAERLAPRVHQQDLTLYEKVLREWDMSGQYGVSAVSQHDGSC